MAPNRASGQSYKGAVDRGHFYVFVDKVGTVAAWTNYPSCQPTGYGVRGYGSAGAAGDL